MTTCKPRIRTIKQALARASVLWGKNAMVQHNPKCPNATERERICARQKDLYAKKKAGTATPEEVKEWTDNRGCGVSAPYSVGAVMMGMFFKVKGQGDSWDEAFAKAGDK